MNCAWKDTSSIYFFKYPRGKCSSLCSHLHVLYNTYTSVSFPWEMHPLNQCSSCSFKQILGTTLVSVSKIQTISPCHIWWLCFYKAFPRITENQHFCTYLNTFLLLTLTWASYIPVSTVTVSEHPLFMY